ncbi:MAG: hypothetical protein IIA75_07705 [Proteobacteria bacterium]|nr:hypothetical protein [Pseudomonadota bacterium]
MILQPTQNTVQVESDTNIFANIELLQNLSLTIGSLTNAQYVWQYDKSASSIGKHIRHIIDHYNCFFKHLAQAYIDYDDRTRENAVETKTHQACKELSNIILQLGKFNAHQAKPIRIYITATPDTNPEPAASSLQRELLFLQSHTIHHMAVIQLLLNRIGISVDTSFALAPSPASYNQSVANHHA